MRAIGYTIWFIGCAFAGVILALFTVGVVFTKAATRVTGRSTPTTTSDSITI